MKITLIHCFVFICLFVYLPEWLNAQKKAPKPVMGYIHSLAKPDGGYGWADQPDGHLTPTFAVIGMLQELHQLPTRRQPLIEFVRNHHPQFGLHQEGGPSGTEERDLVYQQIQSIQWLGGNTDDFADKVKSWMPQYNKVSNFEEHGYPVFIQELMTPVCRNLLGLSADSIRSRFTTYITERLRANGSFNNTLVRDGGDGNILNTYWALYSLRLLGPGHGQDTKLIAWLQSCQLKNGGFTYQPDPAIAANDDVAYTWAAVKSFQLLAASPKDREGCIQYLLSLRNPDGGFGRQPGEPSSPMASYYAVDALSSLKELNRLDKQMVIAGPATRAEDLSGMKVYTVQFEAQGSGSPEEAVMLAKLLRIHLWGAKNGRPGWIQAAQRIAKENKVPVSFFRADESYGKTVQVAGLGTFSHILDYVAPLHDSLHMANSPSWQQFTDESIQPLMKSGGALIWQVSNNEPLSRMLLDEAVRKGSYAGISSAHFGQNFLFWLPYLYEYRYQLPFIALQDAHGTEAWWWANHLSGYRTLFLAKSPTYENMMDALKHNRVAAVRHDSINEYRTRILGGAAGVQEYILSHMNEWKWWSDSTLRPERPWAAITVLKPTDSLEIARPSVGINVRIRCWWTTAQQYFLQNRVVDMETLRLDNQMVKPEHITQKDPRGSVIDDYYLLKLPDIAAGDHRIEAVFQDVQHSGSRKMVQNFTVR